MTASIMSRCDFESSQISAQDTVGVAGDDIMFHIQVSLCSHHRIITKFSGVLTNDQRKVHAKGQGQRSRSQRSQPNLTVSGL